MNIRDLIMNSPSGWLHKMAIQAILVGHGVDLGLRCDWERVRADVRKLMMGGRP